MTGTPGSRVRRAGCWLAAGGLALCLLVAGLATVGGWLLRQNTPTYRSALPPRRASSKGREGSRSGTPS